MAASSEQRDYAEEKKQLDTEDPAASQQTIETKEDVIDHVSKEYVIAKDSTTPESEGHETEDEDIDDNTNGVPVRPQSSRASSIFSRSQTVVPRAHRRGLLGRFAVIPEIERPPEYTTKTKWIITAIIALAAAAAPIGAGIFYPALPEMSVDLKTTPTITNLAVALYMLSMSIFPLWWSSFSETLGRRTIYITSFALFVVFAVLSAVSVNIEMLIVMRVFTGGAAASVQAVGAGTIADIWEPAYRGRAMGIFYLGPLCGPLFAPVIGGGLAQALGWRANMWFLAIYGGLTLILLIFCLPETLERKHATRHTPTQTDEGEVPTLVRTSTRRSVATTTKKAGRHVKRFLIDPLAVLLYLRFMPIAITVYSAAIAFGSLFIMNISIQSTFSKAPYGFSEVIVGLMYFPPSLGYVCASVVGGRWVDMIMAREAKKAGRYDENGKLIFLPEDRMKENMWLAATVYPAALIWFGWTIDKGVHWIVPSIANFFFGFGSMLVFGAVTTMLTEFMPKRSSSGVAVNNFVRNIFSCVGGIVTQPLLDVMGVGYLCTLIGLFAWVTGNLAILALKKWGPKWRVRMDAALKA
ncbi:MFS general substrate transporter [Coniochaeta sp. PMI_546]|nr:MFS general substrate transporter [Coniochaeta sp. PMI_546]